MFERVASAVPVGGPAAQWAPWSWKWDDAELPVPVAYNPAGAPPEVGPDVFLAGLDAWSAVPSSRFRYRYAGITDNTASLLERGPDGENVISWAFLDCAKGCVLGITSKESAHEVDMLLNNNPEAAALLGVGATVDWRTVILHELGHMAGLEHSCPVPFGPCTPAEADAVMFYQYRGILRKLAPDDIAGLSARYPVASVPPVVTPVPTPTPPVPAFPVALNAGWNLVLLPPANISTITSALPCIETVYGWSGRAWERWVRGFVPVFQTLAEVSASRAYWALASAACSHQFP